MRFNAMGLSGWSLICMIFLAPSLITYFTGGDWLEETDALGLLYIIPAALLVVRCFFAVSAGPLVHVVLAVVCGALTLLGVEIFGSRVNWMWIFILAGTGFTLLLRAGERRKVIAPNRKWYAEQSDIVAKADREMIRAEKEYASIGAEAAKKLRTLRPQESLPPRKPWFLPREKKAAVQLSFHETDFFGPIQDHTSTIEKHDRKILRESTYSNQKLGYQTVTKETAQKYTPFFGMKEPDGIPNLRYKAFVHQYTETWTETTIICHSFTKRSYTGERSAAKEALEDRENEILREDVNIAYARIRDPIVSLELGNYMDKRKRFLNSLSDFDETTYEYTTTNRSEQLSQDRKVTGAVLVVTEQGELVGLYCSRSRASMDFCAHLAKKHWGAELTPAVLPYDKYQEEYLRQKFL